MKFKIPSLKEAFELVKDTKSFLVKKEVVDGEEFAIFSYRFVDYKEFLERPERLEFRGIAYHISTGQSFLSIHKFFNYNEVPETDRLFNKKNNYLAFEKIDGSLIVPILLKDRLLVKSRNTFFSEHSKVAYQFIKENKNYEEFIRFCYKEGLQPIFEFVSPFHRIIIEYPRTDLVLIQVRDLDSGNYISLYESFGNTVCSRFGIKIPMMVRYKIDDIIRECETKEGIEGYVVISDFSSPIGFKKFKTKWYLERHRINTDLKVYDIVEFVLNDKIDDVLSVVVSEELRQYILSISNIINNFRYNVLNKIEEILKLNLTRKEMALKYRGEFLFPVIMSSVNAKDEKEILKRIDDFILKNCRKEKQTIEFLEKIESEINKNGVISGNSCKKSKIRRRC